MIHSSTLDSIWKALASDNHVIVFCEQDLMAKAKAVLDFLRPCGFLEFSPVAATLKNGYVIMFKKQSQNSSMVKGQNLVVFYL